MGLFDKFFGKGKSTPKQPETQTPHTFADVVRGFQHCVLRAQEITERHNLEILDRYFDEEKDEKTQVIKQRPKMLSFEIMKDHWMHVPMICIIPPGSLQIQEVEIDMAMKIDRQVLKKAAKEEDREKDKTTRSSLEVSFTSMSETNGGGKSNAMRVKMKFKALPEPVEGMTRILEEYTKTIKPMPKGEAPEGTSVAMDAKPDEGAGQVMDMNGASPPETPTPPSE